MRMILRFALLLTVAASVAQSQQLHIGEIDFFGTSGVDVQKVRSVLPVRKGDAISEDHVDNIRHEINSAIQPALGHVASDIAIVCCDHHGDLMIYVGLSGRNTSNIRLLPAPTGSSCLPNDAVALSDEAMSALAEAVQKGNTGEDDSNGYSLSNDPDARAKQLAMRKYALSHQPTLDRALRECAEAKQRQSAAEMLGYARKSAEQIRSLVRASRDPDEGVRNNAIRALAVLAGSSPHTASEILPDSFVEMLNSGVWSDRNKVGLLLMSLSRSRVPHLLKQLRNETLPSLIEMARWQEFGHADAYRVILGRIAGFDEAQIEKLIESGKTEEIIATVENRFHH